MPNKLLSAWGLLSRLKGMKATRLSREPRQGRANPTPLKTVLLGTAGFIYKYWSGSSWRTLADLDNNQTFTGTNKFGSATNNLQIDSNGFLSANGTSTWFDDLRVELTVRTVGAKSPSYVNVTGGIYAYEFDDAGAGSEKEINFKMQTPHGWKIASTLHMHVHWVAATTGSAGNKIRWGLEYTNANINAVFPSTTTIYGEDAVNPPSTTPTAMTHYLTEFSDIDMTGKELSNFLLCRLFRNSSHANDTYAGSAYVIGVDAHIEYDTLGSNSEFSK